MLALIIGGVMTLVIAYVVYTLVSSSGSEFSDTSIEAFIIKADGDAAKNKTPKTDHYKRKYDKEGRQLLILYGTEYGFSEEIAKKLFDRIESNAQKNEQFLWQPRVVDVKHHEFIDFSKEHLIYIVISTAGDGIPPSEARPFCNWLGQCEENIRHINYSVLALGDTNYPHFCRTGKTVDERLHALGARCLVPRHDVDMEDWEIINRWLDQVQASLDEVHVEPALDYLDIPNTDSMDTGPSRTRPFVAKMTVKRSLTVEKGNSDKETIHCEFDLEGSDITWTSGDALGIYPDNNPTEVNTLLESMGRKDTEMVDVPKWAYEPKPDEAILDIRNTLMKYYDLKTVRPELLQLLQGQSSGTSCKGELDDLLKDGISRKNTFLHEYLYEREVADVLNDFQEATSRLSTAHILGQMKALQPRYYSIASSPVKTQDRCSVAVAVVRYSTLGLARTGVTTTFLQDRLDVNQSCPVFISQNPEFRLPSDEALPIIMVGPGTGIAPFMAFISERLYSQKSGKNVLYFGCRHKNQDFLYKEELETWARDGDLHLRTAFSRDQPDKVYVQNLISEDKDFLWDLVHHHAAHIYICGDARHMAHDVHKALVAMFCEKGEMSETEAESQLIDLEGCGRYQKDVWVT